MSTDMLKESARNYYQYRTIQDSLRRPKDDHEFQLALWHALLAVGNEILAMNNNLVKLLDKT